MPYIMRDSDGERFIVPTYRDTLKVAHKNDIKQEILSLSQNYGQYIVLQKKTNLLYEVAFSTEMGFLLGESIWHYLKKPLEMVYCEAIPNTLEVILVIVKAGSVYLDGRFAADSVPDELVVFLTQQNHFDIYIHGNVPISHTKEAGKFSFDLSSIKSFNVLEQPIFPNLPGLKTYQLQLIDPVLKAHGIGTFPARSLFLILTALLLGWFSWSYFTSPSTEPPPVQQVDPYQDYLGQLDASSPQTEIDIILQKLYLLTQLPGWQINHLHYVGHILSIDVISQGGTIQILSDWADANHFTLHIEQHGLSLSMPIHFDQRHFPRHIDTIDHVTSELADRIGAVYPGNHLQIKSIQKKDYYTQMPITINLTNVSPMVLSLISQKLNDLPLTLENITVNIDQFSNISGSLNLLALGN